MSAPAPTDASPILSSTSTCSSCCCSSSSTSTSSASSLSPPSPHWKLHPTTASLEPPPFPVLPTISPSAPFARQAKVKLFLLRHAQSTGNVHYPARIGGASAGLSLTALGRLQATALGKRLDRTQTTFDVIYCSTARRARETAALALREMVEQNGSKYTFSEEDCKEEVPRGVDCADQPPEPEAVVYCWDDLLEQSQGAWEGAARSEVHTAEVLSQMAREHMAFRAPVPGAESMYDVRARLARRVTGAIERLAQWSAADGAPRSLAVFGHQAAFQALLSGILQSRPDWAWLIELANASITELHLDARGWHLVRTSDAAHTEELSAAPAPTH